MNRVQCFGLMIPGTQSSIPVTSESLLKIGDFYYAAELMNGKTESFGAWLNRGMRLPGNSYLELAAKICIYDAWERNEHDELCDVAHLATPQGAD